MIFFNYSPGTSNPSQIQFLYETEFYIRLAAESPEHWSIIQCSWGHGHSKLNNLGKGFLNKKLHKNTK